MNLLKISTESLAYIIIDKSLIDGYQRELVRAQKQLDETCQRLEVLQKQADADKLLSIQQASQYLGKSEDAIRYYRRFGLEPYKKGKKALWYRKGEIDAWLAEGRISLHKR